MKVQLLVWVLVVCWTCRLTLSSANGVDRRFGRRLLQPITQDQEFLDIQIDDGERELPPPLIAAVGQGSLEKVQGLLNKGLDPGELDKDGRTPLWHAAYSGLDEIVQLLLKNGADPDTKSTTGTTALFVASQNGYINTVKMLIGRNASLEAMSEKGATPLLVAAQSGHAGVVEMLLNAGAEVNVTKTESRQSAVWSAAFHGYDDVVDVLIAAGADLDMPEGSGATALYAAAQEGNVVSSISLLDAGAGVDLGTHVGVRPLHVAAGRCHPEMLAVLLVFRADLDVVDSRGRTAQDVVCIANLNVGDRRKIDRLLDLAEQAPNREVDLDVVDEAGIVFSREAQSRLDCIFNSICPEDSGLEEVQASALPPPEKDASDRVTPDVKLSPSSSDASQAEQTRDSGGSDTVTGAGVQSEVISDSIPSGNNDDAGGTVETASSVGLLKVVVPVLAGLFLAGVAMLMFLHGRPQNTRRRRDSHQNKENHVYIHNPLADIAKRGGSEDSPVLGVLGNNSVPAMLKPLPHPPTNTHGAVDMSCATPPKEPIGEEETFSTVTLLRRLRMTQNFRPTDQVVSEPAQTPNVAEREGSSSSQNSQEIKEYPAGGSSMPGPSRLTPPPPRPAHPSSGLAFIASPAYRPRGYHAHGESSTLSDGSLEASTVPTSRRTSSRSTSFGTFNTSYLNTTPPSSTRETP